MRDPADVIATALHENVVQGMTVEQWREKAVQVLAALRDEYGTIFAEIKFKSPSPYHPNTLYARTQQKHVIPVPAAAEERDA